MDNSAIQRYLHEVLGGNARLQPWAGAAELPFYLQDLYGFAEVSLFDLQCVLMIAQGPSDAEVDIRRHLEIVSRYAGRDVLVIYVVQGLASYERRSLIARGVPFIVPGNQMFLPPLGMDLREYFRKRAEPANKPFSPATQLFLFTALLREWEKEVHPEALNDQAAYTPMTLSRAIRELQEAGLVDTFQVGREKWLRFDKDQREVWQDAQPWLRSPVLRTEWAVPLGDLDKTPLAGLSALAAQSALADPLHPVWAISSGQWKAAKGMRMHPLQGPEPGAGRWQIWRYDPLSLAQGGVVDPLSLIVSCRNDPDERVQQAVEKLEQALPW
ncbi:hypothetical protein ACW7G2_13265 [Luteimonas sp. A277]